MEQTREQWLNGLVNELRPMYGSELPKVVHVSVGFPSKGGMRSKTIGECWVPEASADGAPQIFIHPKVSDGLEAGAIVAHELVHAAGKRGHKGEFKQLATKIGLEGKMTSTVAGEALQATLAAIIDQIGPYPHPALSGDGGKPKQSTRLIKVECPDCGYTVRTTQKWLDTGTPKCPCGTWMEVSE